MLTSDHAAVITVQKFCAYSDAGSSAPHSKAGISAPCSETGSSAPQSPRLAQEVALKDVEALEALAFMF